MERHRVNPFLGSVSDRRQDIGTIIRDELKDPHDVNFGDYHEVRFMKLELIQKGWVVVKGERQTHNYTSGHFNQFVDHHRIRPIIWVVKEGTWKVIPSEEISGDGRRAKAPKPQVEAGYDLSSLECYHLRGCFQDRWSVTVANDEYNKERERTIQMNGIDTFLCSSSLGHTPPVACDPLDAKDKQILHLHYEHFSDDLVFLPPCYEAVEARYPAAVRFLVPRPSELAKLEKEELVKEK